MLMVFANKQVRIYVILHPFLSVKGGFQNTSKVNYYWITCPQRLHVKVWCILFQ